MNPLKNAVHYLGRRYMSAVNKGEFEAQRPRPINERPIEFAFLFSALRTYWPKTFLDVGTGETAVPSLIGNCGIQVTAIDNIKDYWPRGMVNRHFHVMDEDILAEGGERTFDMVSCISVLEHINDDRAAIRGMFRRLNPGGHLVLTCPYNETTFDSNVYKLPDATIGRDLPYVCKSYSRANLDAWLKQESAVIVDQEYWRFWEGKLWATGERHFPPAKVSASEPHQLTCLLLRK